MNNEIIKQVEDKVLVINNQNVLLDSDIAKFYGVETKRINEAVKNNPDKFPEGYMIKIDSAEAKALKSKNSTLKPAGRGQHSKYTPTAFTEKGLYMLATILKSKQAVNTTFAIIETFVAIRETGREIAAMADAKDPAEKSRVGEKISQVMSNVLTRSLPHKCR
jgi:phage regulator Rha-like protein